MEDSGLRKSSRIKSRNRTSYLEDDFDFETAMDICDDTFEVKSSLNREGDGKSKPSTSAVANQVKKNSGAKKQSVNGKNEQLTCPLCKVILATETELHKHITKHNKDKQDSCVVCLQCYKVCVDQAAYSRHMKSHSGNRKFKCQQCGKAFLEKSTLKRHTRTHIQDKPFTCDVCFKSFRDNPALLRHQKIHSQRQKSFHCILCDKSFTDKHGLKRHEKTHTGLRPFQCRVCLKTFSETGSYRRHMKIHTGVRNFTCSVCQKSFLEKQSLRRHQRNVCGLVNGDSIGSNGHQFGSNEEDSSGSTRYRKDDRRSEGDPYDSVIHQNSSDSCNLGAEKSENSSNYESPRLKESHSTDRGLHSIGTAPPIDDDKSSVDDGSSFRSLLKRDPKLFGDISKIVESIGSYEEMLDLCSDKGQSVLDVGLNYDKVEDQLLCFECGEPLIEGDNFRKSDKKVKNSLKCMNCEDEKEDYGEPPVLTAEVNHSEAAIQVKTEIDHCSETKAIKNTFFEETFIKTEPADIKQIILSVHSKTPDSQSDLENQKQVTVPQLEYDDPNIPSVFPCHLCTKVFATSSFLSQHLELHRKSPYKCMVCGKTFTNSPSLKRHMTVHTGEKPYTCPHCRKPFRDPSNFSKHKKTCVAWATGLVDPLHTVDDGMENISPILTELKYEPAPLMEIKKFEEESTKFSSTNHDDTKALACLTCGKSFENQHSLDKHMKSHRGKAKMTCLECGKSFSDSFSLKRHVRIHASTRPFVCQYCQRGYCDNWSLKKHQSRGCVVSELLVPPDFLHPCTQCTRVFPDLEYLQEHVNIHKGILKFKCDICLKRFSEAFNLKRHQRIHALICPGCEQEFKTKQTLTEHLAKDCPGSPVGVSRDGGYACPQCQRTYSTKSYLERHKRFHLNFKPHVCEFCNKRFTEAFTLRRHIKTHSVIKPFKCEGCTKSFLNLACLKRHLSANSACKSLQPPEKIIIYNCQVCTKTFSKNYLLVRHMNVHSEDRPFSCNVCQRAYKDTSSLKRHLLIHEGVKNFICTVCGKDFFYADSLKRHMNGSCGKNSKTRRPCKRKKKKTNNNIKMKNNNTLPDSEVKSAKMNTETQLEKTDEVVVTVSEVAQSTLNSKQMISYANKLSSRCLKQTKNYHCLQCYATFSRRLYHKLHMKSHHIATQKKK